MKSHKYHYPPKPSQTRLNYYANLLNYINEHYYIILNYINTKLFKEFNNYMKSIYVIEENYFIKLTQPEYYANLVGISCIMNEANEVIRILQSPSIFIHQAYDLILKHIRNMFQYKNYILQLNDENVCRCFRYINYIKTNRINSNCVLDFLNEYINCLISRMINISGPTNLTKEFLLSIDSFERFLEEFRKENVNNSCFKYMKVNNSLFKELDQIFHCEDVENNEDINTNFLSVFATTCSVESSFSVRKNLFQFNQMDSTTKSKMLLRYNLSNNGHDIFVLSNNSLDDKLSYVNMENTEDESDQAEDNE